MSWSKKEIAKLKKLIDYKLSPTDISFILDRSYMSVISKLKQMEIPRENKSLAKYSISIINKVEKLRKANVSYTIIGEVLDIPRGSVTTIVNRKLKHLIDDYAIDGYITLKQYKTKYKFNNDASVLYYVKTNRLKGVKQSKFWYLEDKDCRKANEK